MALTPLYDRIVVRRTEEEERSSGGIYIPQQAKEKPQQGVVLHVGSGRISDTGVVTPLVVKQGDSILFGKYAGTEIKVDGEDVLIMREEEVLGVLS